MVAARPLRVAPQALDRQESRSRVLGQLKMARQDLTKRFRETPPAPLGESLEGIVLPPLQENLGPLHDVLHLTQYA